MTVLAESQIDQLLSALPGWRVVDRAGRLRIEKVYHTGSFLAGLDFVTRLAALAEQFNHHPEVLLTYPQVRITLTTHDAGGLTDRDFELARRIDSLPT
jgi:4a-hydroxytetrahydrobiopterin dehydratase